MALAIVSIQCFCKEKKQENNESTQQTKRKSIKTTPYIHVSETYLSKNTWGARHSLDRPHKDPLIFVRRQY